MSANMHVKVLAHSPAAKHAPSSHLCQCSQPYKKTTENCWCTMGTWSDLLNSQLPKSLSHISGTRLTRLFFFNRWNWSDLFKGPILFRPCFFIENSANLWKIVYLSPYFPQLIFFYKTLHWFSKGETVSEGGVNIWLRGKLSLPFVTPLTGLELCLEMWN